MGLMIVIALASAFSVSMTFRSDNVAVVSGLGALVLVPMLPVVLGIEAIGNSMIAEGALEYATFYYLMVVGIPLVIAAASVTLSRLFEELMENHEGVFFLLLLGYGLVCLAALVMSLLAWAVLPLAADSFPLEGDHEWQTVTVSYPELKVPLILSSLTVGPLAYWFLARTLSRIGNSRSSSNGKGPGEQSDYKPDPFANRTP